MGKDKEIPCDTPVSCLVKHPTMPCSLEWLRFCWILPNLDIIILGIYYKGILRVCASLQGDLVWNLQRNILRNILPLWDWTMPSTLYGQLSSWNFFTKLLRAWAYILLSVSLLLNKSKVGNTIGWVLYKKTWGKLVDVFLLLWIVLIPWAYILLSVSLLFPSPVKKRKTKKICSTSKPD